MERAEGIIINKREYREADLIYTAYTKELGKISLFAKGARKITAKLRPHLELFNRAFLYWVRGRRIRILTDVEVVRNFSREFSQNPSAFRCASCFSKYVDERVMDEERDMKLWRLVSRGLDTLLRDGRDNPKRLQLFLPYVSLKMSNILGFAPDLYHCVSCNARLSRDRANRFRIREGRVVCGTCPQSMQDIELDEHMLKLLRVLLEKDWSFVRRLKQQDKKELLILTKLSRDFLFYFP